MNIYACIMNIYRMIFHCSLTYKNVNGTKLYMSGLRALSTYSVQVFVLKLYGTILIERYNIGMSVSYISIKTVISHIIATARLRLRFLFFSRRMAAVRLDQMINCTPFAPEATLEVSNMTVTFQNHINKMRQSAFKTKITQITHNTIFPSCIISLL